MRIAVLGSAFDPPTRGHLDVIHQCYDKFDAIWLIPAFSHAFNKKMSNYLHRVEMTMAFAKDIKNPIVKAVPCEDKIKPTTPNLPVFSLDLMQYFKSQAPNHQYSLVIGPDNAKTFDKFYEADRLKTEFTPFIVHERVSVRSTQVRERLNKGLSINELVTPWVANYIHKNNVYPHTTSGL